MQNKNEELILQEQTEAELEISVTSCSIQLQ